MQKGSLFSQEALDKLRTPEKLDTLLHVTNPMGWMAIISVFIILLGIVIWSFMGSFTVTTNGLGMIMDSRGTIAIKHTGGGRVETIRVSSGNAVEQGDLLMTLTNPAQTAETSAAGHNLSLAKNSSEVQGRAADFDSKSMIVEATKNVYIQYNGIVGEVLVRPGDVVSSNDTLCTIRLNEGTNDLSGVLYVPVDQAKRIKRGMSIQLNPSGISSSKNGSLVGIVRSISEYPVNIAGMQRSLANDTLPQMISQQLKNALVEVRFDLVADPNDNSGFLWTSTVGKHPKVTPGTYVSGMIIIERQPPIKRVFSKINEWLRSR